MISDVPVGCVKRSADAPRLGPKAHDPLGESGIILRVESESVTPRAGGLRACSRLDHRESFQGGNGAEPLVGTDEMVEREGAVKVPGDGQLNRIEGAE